MPYPAGIITRTVTVGGDTALESAEPLVLRADIKASRGLALETVAEALAGADDEGESHR